MARKKIIFVIVEGPSDDEALGAVMSRIFDSNSLYVKIMHCDITTEHNVVHIYNKISKIVQQYAKENHFTKNDFKRVVHITDTDGAFIPDDHIIDDQERRNTLYTEEEIITAHKDQLRTRNRWKSHNLNALMTVSSVWNIPYDIYYMSRNLDHVLHNKLNSSSHEKEYDSYMFAKKYKDIPQEFLKYISESDFSVKMPYFESWEYIKEGCNSLKRHTNLGLCFIESEIGHRVKAND